MWMFGFPNTVYCPSNFMNAPVSVSDAAGVGAGGAAEPERSELGDTGGERDAAP